MPGIARGHFAEFGQCWALVEVGSSSKCLRHECGSIHSGEMSWKVLITARTLNEVGTEAVKILRNAGCELTIPPRFGPYPADELQPLLSGHDAVFASMDKFTAEVLTSPAA